MLLPKEAHYKTVPENRRLSGDQLELSWRMRAQRVKLPKLIVEATLSPSPFTTPAGSFLLGESLKEPLTVAILRADRRKDPTQKWSLTGQSSGQIFKLQKSGSALWKRFIGKIPIS